MNQAQRDRMQKAAEKAHAMIPDTPGLLALKWEYIEAYKLGYTQAAKDAQAALDIAREALITLRDDSAPNRDALHIINEALAAIEKELG